MIWCEIFYDSLPSSVVSVKARRNFLEVGTWITLCLRTLSAVDQDHLLSVLKPVLRMTHWSYTLQLGTLQLGSCRVCFAPVAVLFPFGFCVGEGRGSVLLASTTSSKYIHLSSTSYADQQERHTTNLMTTKTQSRFAFFATPGYVTYCYCLLLYCLQ